MAALTMSLNDESGMAALLRDGDLWYEAFYRGRYADVAAYPGGPLAHLIRHVR